MEILKGLKLFEVETIITTKCRPKTNKAISKELEKISDFDKQ